MSAKVVVLGAGGLVGARLSAALQKLSTIHVSVLQTPAAARVAALIRWLNRTAADGGAATRQDCAVRPERGAPCGRPIPHPAALTRKQPKAVAAAVLEDPRVSVVLGDLTDSATIERLIDPEGCTRVSPRAPAPRPRISRAAGDGAAPGRAAQRVRGGEL